MQLFARRFDTGQPVRVDLVDERISTVTPADPGPTPLDQWPWIAPGLLDIQINGYRGQEFSSPDLTARMVLDIVTAYDAFGVTRCCPTLTTHSLEVLEHALATIDAACRSYPEVEKRIAGIHLEAPYLAPDDGPRGAHPREHCRRPSWDEFQRFQEAAAGRIRILTMSVEFDESPPFVSKVAAAGVIVAIGHTAADSDHIRRAVDAGARLSTHLGNGSHPMIPRHHNYIWDQLAEDRLTATLIVDGHHLPPPVVKTFVRAKTPERCILISDMSGLAGLPPGRHQADTCELEILPSGKLVLAGQREILAGASAPLGTGIANLMHFAGVDLETAVGMAVHHPARLLGLTAAALAPGDPADLVLFHLREPGHETGPCRFDVLATILDGQTVHGSAWQPS